MQQKDDIGFLIKLIHDGIDRAFHQELGRNGPTRSQLNVLNYLSQHDGEKVRVKDVVSYLHIDQSTASGIIKRMEENGYLICCQDPEDRRQKVISRSPAWTAPSAEKAREGVSQIEDTLLEGLTETERAELRRMLGIVYQNLQNH